MNEVKILLLNDQFDGSCNILQDILASSFNLRCLTIPDGEAVPAMDELTENISAYQADVIFLVLSSNSLKQAREVYQSIKSVLYGTPAIFVIEDCQPDEMIELLKLGVADFIIPPLKAADILPRVWRLLDHLRNSEKAHQRIKERLALQQLDSENPALKAELKKIPLISKCDASVLISGETGTGKDVYARAIHYLSPRARKPFVPVNCGAIPVELVENELFGHERGAFTGAATSRLGLLQEAEGGTLLLDEVDCLPLLAQIKLLRFIQEKEYRPLGSTKTCHANVRIIAASNVDLGEAVTAGKLRQDLYYRLNVIRLVLPPLRQRREDIPLLVKFFLRKYSVEFNKQATSIPPEAMTALMLYDWPGNVRELEHVIERAVVLSEDETIRLSDIHIAEQQQAPSDETFQQAKEKIVNQFEKSYIQRLLLAYEGNITKAAQAAKKNRRAFWQLIRKHKIDVQSFRHGAGRVAV